MGAILGLFRRKNPEHPISNPGVRIVNFWRYHFRGILGFCVPMLVLPWLLEKGHTNKTAMVVWMWMFWTLLLQPVNVPVVGLIPTIALPLLGTMSSKVISNCYFTAGIALFIIGGYVLMLLNNSDVDRRIILTILYPRGKSQGINKIMLLFKVSVAAYITSMLSNRLIATHKLMEHLIDSITCIGPDASKEKKMKRMRYILSNAAVTSSAIGSIGVLHSSYSVMAFRAIHSFHIEHKVDDFNFLQYSLFALPTSLAMFILNLIYNIVLMTLLSKDSINSSHAALIREAFVSAKKEALKRKKYEKLHEYLSVIFYLMLMGAYFSRWSKLFNYGWSTFKSVGEKPLVLDVTVAAGFAIILSIIPKSYNFLGFFKKNNFTKSTVPSKAESTLLFWKFVDKNTNYGYILLIGAGVVINKAIKLSKLDEGVRTYGKFLTDMKFENGLLLICLASVVLSNIMTSVGALIMILPFVLHMSPLATTENDAEQIWVKKTKFAALAVGIGTNFGFASPFMFTPPYFSKTVAKVPLFMQILYSLGSCIICLGVLWVMVAFVAPKIFY